MIVGYARVSTDGQTLDAQQSALVAAGATHVFAEKSRARSLSVASSPRQSTALGAGDVLLVTRLDRLARSTRDLLNTLDAIGNAGAGFRSLADAWADTTTPHGTCASMERSLSAALRCRSVKGSGSSAPLTRVLERSTLRIEPMTEASCACWYSRPARNWD